MKFLYLPIETWSREYHAKVLLSLYAVRDGWQVIIGPKSQMHRRLHRLPEGVVMQFGFHENYASEMIRLRKYGHIIVSADEEGLVTLSPEHYKRYRVSPKTLEQCERCYCWGNIHAQMIKDVGGALKNKLFVTGNPRLDLLKPNFRSLIEFEAAKISEKYGKFILLNGNFGSYNHSMGIDYTWKSLDSKGWTKTIKDKDFHYSRVELQGLFFKAFHNVIPEIANEKLKVIVRPHPSESLIPWDELSRANPGKVIVAREGNIIPWLQAAEIILHNGCTTAVEAFVLGKPVISYRPKKITVLETELPNEISMQATNQEELMYLIDNAFSINIKTRDSRLKYASEFIDTTDHTACEKIVNTLPEVKNHSNVNFSSTRFRLDQYYFRLREIIAKFKYRNSSNYTGLKCGPLELSETLSLLERYSSLSNMDLIPKVNSIGNGLLQLK